VSPNLPAARTDAPHEGALRVCERRFLWTVRKLPFAVAVR
jgi:hypothetical protein